MKIDINRKDAAILLYALQLLLDKMQESGYADNDIGVARDVAESVFCATLQAD